MTKAGLEGPDLNEEKVTKAILADRNEDEGEGVCVWGGGGGGGRERGEG